MYKYRTIANYFIGKSLEEKIMLTPMKLQKLIYHAHGWYLALYDKPLLDKEIEVGKYGPVISELYQDLKIYGNSPIIQPIKEFNGDDFITPIVKEDEIKKFLCKIWEEYSPYSEFKLSNSLNSPESPWDKSLRNNLSKIDNKIIGDFFSNMIDSNER